MVDVCCFFAGIRLLHACGVCTSAAVLRVLPLGVCISPAHAGLSRHDAQRAPTKHVPASGPGATGQLA